MMDATVSDGAGEICTTAQSHVITGPICEPENAATPIAVVLDWAIGWP